MHLNRPSDLPLVDGTWASLFRDSSVVLQSLGVGGTYLVTHYVVTSYGLTSYLPRYLIRDVD